VKGQLWGWTRKTGYNHIIAVMKKAALSGPRPREGASARLCRRLHRERHQLNVVRNCSGMHR